jgi:molybdopterin converting factor small subunit
MSNVRIRLFARARELAGAEVVVAAGPTVGDVRRALADAYPVLAGLLPRSAFAVNAEYAGDDVAVRPGDDLAVLPPVSGG